MTKEELEDALEIANTAKSVPSRMVTKLLSERKELVEAARAMVAANDAPTNGDDGGAEERAQAWRKLRESLKLADA